MNAQKGGGGFVIATGSAPGIDDGATLGIVDAAMEGGGILVGKAAFEDALGEVFELDFGEVAEHDSALD